MDSFQNEYCTFLMNKIKNKKYTSVIIDPPSNIYVNVTFNCIMEKLRTNSYKTFIDWSLDLIPYLCDIEEGLPSSNNNKYVVASVIEWLDRKLDNFPKNKEELLKNKAKKYINEIRNIIKLLKWDANNGNLHVTPNELIEIEEIFDKTSDKETMLKFNNILSRDICGINAIENKILSTSIVPKKTYIDIIATHELSTIK